MAVRTVVTTWPFLVSLLVLLTNDAWLKQAYPGFISGKLSDFAGIAIVTLLMLSVHPHRRRIVYGAIIFGFAWWKSPLSQTAIDAINPLLPFQIGRTVDFTDMIAFLVMPACAAVASNPAAFTWPSRTLNRLLAAPVLAVTALGLMATSVIPTRQDYQVRSIDGVAELDREAVAKTISEVASQHGLKCEDCAAMASAGHYVGQGISLKYTFSGARSVAFRVQAYPDGLIFGAGGKEKADRLRDDLKARLASAFKNLEYVEALDARPDASR